MLQSNLIKNSRNRISEGDTVKAFSYDKRGKILASVYDSGFTTIDGVISELNRKGGGWLKEIKEVAITNEDRCWFGRYTKQGRKI